MSMKWNPNNSAQFIFHRQPMAGAHISAYPAPESGTTGVTSIRDTDLTQLLKNFGTVKDLIGYRLARTIAEIAVDLLSHSQPRVPYYSGGQLGQPSTGWTRTSGEARIQFGHTYKIVGKGNVDGSVSADFSVITMQKIKNANFLSANVGYDREENGQDLALWLHEALLPYSERSGKIAGSGLYYARTPGTGPKFLEIPFEERRNIYAKMLIDCVNERNLGKTIKSMTKIKESKKDKYVVPIIAIDGRYW